MLKTKKTPTRSPSLFVGAPHIVKTIPSTQLHTTPSAASSATAIQGSINKIDAIATELAGYAADYPTLTDVSDAVTTVAADLASAQALLATAQAATDSATWLASVYQARTSWGDAVMARDKARLAVFNAKADATNAPHSTFDPSKPTGSGNEPPDAQTAAPAAMHPPQIEGPGSNGGSNQVPTDDTSSNSTPGAGVRAPCQTWVDDCVRNRANAAAQAVAYPNNTAIASAVAIIKQAEIDAKAACAAGDDAGTQAAKTKSDATYANVQSIVFGPNPGGTATGTLPAPVAAHANSCDSLTNQVSSFLTSLQTIASQYTTSQPIAAQKTIGEKAASDALAKCQANNLADANISLAVLKKALDQATCLANGSCSPSTSTTSAPTGGGVVPAAGTAVTTAPASDLGKKVLFGLGGAAAGAGVGAVLTKGKDKTKNAAIGAGLGLAAGLLASMAGSAKTTT